MWLAIQRIQAAALMACGALILFAPVAGFWFRTALGMSAWAVALGNLAVDPMFGGGRRRFGLSSVRIHRLTSATWMSAAGCGLIGAFTIHIAFGLVLSPLVGVFVLVWGSMFRSTLSLDAEPGPNEVSP